MGKYENVTDRQIHEVYQSDRELAGKMAIEKYRNYIPYIVRRNFPSFTANMEDMIQSGSLGLLQALKTFDPDKCDSLMSYSKNFIKNEMCREIRFQTGISSEHYHELHTAVSRAVSAIEAEGEEPTVEAVMKRTGLSYKVAQREMETDYTTVSYEQISNEISEQAAPVDSRAVFEILSGLSDYEKDLMLLKVIEERTFAEIAGKYDKSVYVVEQDYHDVLEKLNGLIS